MKVVVAGAGLSGITAAYRLKQAGHHVTIYEARDRVGGRSWSQALPNGTTIERGGEFVLPEDHAIRALGAELGIPVIGHSVRYLRRTVNGAYQTLADREATATKVEATLGKMTAESSEPLSVHAVLAEALGPDHISHPFYRQLAAGLASDLNQISAIATLKYVAYTPFLDDGGRFLGGNQSIALELSRRLGDAVNLERPLTAVAQDSSGVEFTLADGEGVRADAAVIAVPMAIAKSLSLDFALAEGQQDALDHRTMGVATKFGAPIADLGSVTDTALSSATHGWWTWQSMSTATGDREMTLRGFAGSRATMDYLRIAEGPETWMREIEALRPGIVWAGEPVITDWARDEWTRGSYSIPSLDWHPRDLQAFEQPAGRVAFAGEHTVGVGSLNAAVLSGERAARIIQSDVMRE